MIHIRDLTLIHDNNGYVQLIDKNKKVVLAIKCELGAIEHHLPTVRNLVGISTDRFDIEETEWKDPNNLLVVKKIEVDMVKIHKGYEYHSDNTRPYDDRIFVFSSNLSGKHGAGAAQCAVAYYGAVYGVGVGRTGNSYAIPTKGHDLSILPVEIIAQYVRQFKEYCALNMEKRFYVTRIGWYSGYKDKDIAPLFKDSPDNCCFPEQWRKFLESNLN